MESSHMSPDRVPHAQLLDRKAVALVVLDLQAKLVPAIFEPQRVIRNAQLLLRLAQVLEFQFAPGSEPIEKTSFGCFGEPDFLRRLKQRAPQASSLLVAGIECHICVMQTVLGALEAGYLVHVAADATSSRTQENWQIGLTRMERAGAVISSTEMMVTPEFKALLPFLK
jgi:nicotinamidase-related amidase